MRKVFFSFDWDDVWRVNQVRHSWVTKGSYEQAGFVDAADIEGLKKSTSDKIKRWIDEQLKGTSVTCVLVGEQTADSRWVNYEIQESIKRQNGLLEVYIHNVKDQHRQICSKGDSPFDRPPMNFRPANGPPNYPCCSYYDWIINSGYGNMGDWIEKAAKQAGR